MGVIVVVGIDRQLAAAAEQRDERRVARHRARIAFATDMMVEADNAIGLAHHHMQIVADQKDAAGKLVAQLGNEMIKRRLAGNIDTGQRFVEDQQIGLTGDGAGQQDTGLFAARQRCQLALSRLGNSDPQQRRAAGVAPANRSTKRFTVSGRLGSGVNCCGT